MPKNDLTKISSQSTPQWKAYHELFAEVERITDFTREGLVYEINRDAKIAGKPKCTYSRRSTVYWETEPGKGKRSNAPRWYRREHLHEWLSKQIAKAGETQKYAALLEVIKPTNSSLESSSGSRSKKPSFRGSFEGTKVGSEKHTAKGGDSPSASVAIQDEPSIMNQPVTCEHLRGRAAELKALNRAWRSRLANVITIFSRIPDGKSALVNYWLRINDYFRCEAKVLYWSFAGRGQEKITTGADLFVNWALGELRDHDPSQGAAREKAERLVRLIRRKRILLILDGLETVQYLFETSPDEAEMKYKSIRTLLPKLAACNPGMCIVTTRTMVAELDSFGAILAPVIELPQLSAVAGSELLKDLGARETKKTLAKIVKHIGGSVFVLTALGTFSRDFCGGYLQTALKVWGVKWKRYWLLP